MTKEREWMGVEPTRAAFKHPSDGFEDRGAHQDSTTPMRVAEEILAQEIFCCKLGFASSATCARYELGLCRIRPEPRRGAVIVPSREVA